MTEREQDLQNEMARCIYFNGIQHDCCKAGVNYHDQFGYGVGCFKYLDCLSHEQPGTTVCAKRELPTREQAEETDRLFKVTVLAVNAAKRHAKAAGLKAGNGGVGRVECPTGCGGTIHYRVASVNGHMHAKCTTDGCVSFME